MISPQLQLWCCIHVLLGWPHILSREVANTTLVCSCACECGNNMDTIKKLFCNPEYHITNDVSQSFICKTWPSFYFRLPRFCVSYHGFPLTFQVVTIWRGVHMNNPSHKSISGNKPIIAVLELDCDTRPTGLCTRQVSNYSTLKCAWSECLTHFITRRHDITIRFKSESVSVAVVSQSLTSALPELEKCQAARIVILEG